MSAREADLRELIAELCEIDVVALAFLAKSFTDRLVIVDVGPDVEMSDEIVARLEAYDFRGADEVYGGDERGSFAGEAAGSTRHHFVDIRARGFHQPSVVY